MGGAWAAWAAGWAAYMGACEEHAGDLRWPSQARGARANRDKVARRGLMVAGGRRTVITALSSLEADEGGEQHTEGPRERARRVRLGTGCMGGRWQSTIGVM